MSQRPNLLDWDKCKDCPFYDLVNDFPYCYAAKDYIVTDTNTVPENCPLLGDNNV